MEKTVIEQGGLKMGKFVAAASSAIIFVLGLISLSYAFKGSSYQLEVKFYEGIPYISGGFGMEEREAMHNRAGDYNLELSFASQSKNYLGGASVLIKDENGHRILTAASDGPLFYVKLPEEKYAVTATANGKTLERIANVPAKGQVRLYFAWKELNHEMASHGSPSEESHGSTRG